MNKRKAFGIVLFVAIGLFMFTFANPNDKVDNGEGNSQANNTTNEVQNKETDNTNVAPVINLADPTNVPAQNNGNTNGNANGNVVDNTLADAKAKAIDELKNYKKDYEYPDKDKYTEIVNKYVDEINKASNVDEVNKALEDGKDAIDNLIKDIELEKAKEAAKEELRNYNNDVLYSDENQAKVNEIKDEGIKAIDEATTVEEVTTELTTSEEEIDKIQKLTETYFKVVFKGYNGEVLSTQDVLYGNSAKAPQVTSVIDKNITYDFASWNKDFSKVTTELEIDATYIIASINADIYLLTDGEYAKTGTIALKVSEAVTPFVGGEDATVTTNEEEIKAIVDGTLPEATELNYKYEYYALKYEETNGFRIDSAYVIDEEALRRNTVVLTYVTADAIFADGTTKIENKVTTGKNYVSLPEVYVGENVANVIWKDSNNELKEFYTANETLTATLDKTAPVITLNGEVSRELYAQTGTYTEEGFTVSDNYTTLTADDVNVAIALDGESVEAVDYSKVGTYVITYTVADTEGNVGTATRTIKVKADKVSSIKLNKTSGLYYTGDDIEPLILTVKYESGKTATVTEGYTVSGFDTTVKTYTPKTATITFGGKSAEYKYTVKTLKVSSITLNKTSGTYFIGDDIEPLTLTVKYNNGKEETVTSGYIVNGFDNTKPTNHGKASIVYGGKSAEYKYVMKKVEVTSITLNETSGTYFIGDSIKPLTLTVKYNNGKEETVTSGYIVNGFDNTKPTNHGKASIVYGGKSAEYKYVMKKVEVTSITLDKTSGSYYTGDSIEALTLTVKYNNGKEETVTNGYTVTGFNNEVPTTTGKATITYKEGQATYDYTMTKLVVERITLDKTSGTYTIGESMEALTVTAYYNSGKEETVTSGYTVTGFNNQVITTTGKATVTYKEASALYNYTIEGVRLSSITLSRTSGDLIVGENLNDVVVTAHYTDGTSKVISRQRCAYYGYYAYYCVDNYTIDLDNQNVGNNKVATFTYTEDGVTKTATYTYSLKYKAEIVKSGNRYYLTFDINDNAYITNISRADENANNYNVDFTRSYNTYYISKTDYNEMKKMENNNGKQNMVITLNNGTKLTYTKVIPR